MLYKRVFINGKCLVEKL